MKMKIIRIICLALVFAMTLSISAAAISDGQEKTQPFDNNVSITNDYDEAQAVRDIYSSLSPEAKQLFDQLIATDPELLAFHKENVNDSFRVTGIMPYSAASSSLTVLAEQLAVLNLPTAVKYALEAMGAGIVAAADGPLPIGDILLAAATATTVIVIAANWSAISPKWDSIVSAFTTTFTTMVSAVKSAFAEIKSEVPNVQNSVPIGINGKQVTVGNTVYICHTNVQSLSKAITGSNQYFIGVLYAGDVWVDPGKPIPANFARTIIAANNRNVGVVAVSESLARGIAGGFPIGPEIGNGSGNYYWHYHNAMHRSAHIWYPNFVLT